MRDILGSEHEPSPGGLRSHPRLVAVTLVALLVVGLVLVSRNLGSNDPSSLPDDQQPLGLSGCGESPTAWTQDYFAALQDEGSQPVAIRSVSTLYLGVSLTGLWRVSDCGPHAAEPLVGATLGSADQVYLWLRFTVTNCRQARGVTSITVWVTYATKHGDQSQFLPLPTYPLLCKT